MAASPVPSSTGFTLDVPGCSTPQVILVTPATTFEEPGTSAPPTGVGAGERVVVQLDPSASALTAVSVTILLTKVSGAIVSIGTTSFVVADHQGFDHTINVSGGTTYTPAGTSLLTLVAFQGVDAFGVIDADNVSLDAVIVRVHPALPHEPSTEAVHHGHGDALIGVVAASPAPSATGFTLTEAGGASQAVVTDPSTRYFESGATAPSTGVSPAEHVAVDLTQGTPATAEKVVIFLNQLDGTIVSTGATSFVIMDHLGFWRTINVAIGPQYAPAGAALGTLVAGQHVAAFGSVDADTVSLDAQFVDVFTTGADNSGTEAAWEAAESSCPATPGTLPPLGPEELTPTSTSTSTSTPTSTTEPREDVGQDQQAAVRLEGTITSVDVTNNVLVIAREHGDPVTVLVTGTTAYGQGDVPATLQTVAGAVGAQVVIQGTRGPGTETTAVRVEIVRQGASDDQSSSSPSGHGLGAVTWPADWPPGGSGAPSGGPNRGGSFSGGH